MGDWYEVSMDGGGPWGIRLQGGKDFGVPLNVARITPGSKASKKSLCAGDQIIAINNASTEDKTHMQAQNMIKSAGDELVLRLRQGSGSAPIASGVLAAQPKTLYQTEVTHSAAVDHKFNSKPKSFGSSTGSSTSVSHVSVPVKKFDPGEYARKKKEELEKYKEEKQPVVVDSDVLKMLQNTTCNDDNQSSTGLQKSLDTEGQAQVPEGNVAFRMTADGTDLADVSPGSRAVMEDIKNRGTTSLSNTGAATGGSRSFRILQHLTSMDEDLPPPPPELMGHIDQAEEEPPRQVQSKTFKMLEQSVESGTGDQVPTALNKQRNPSYGSASQPLVRNISARVDPHRETATTVDSIPKAPFPAGPNFRVNRPAAPTFRSGSGSSIGAKGPPPPAVNAGEIVNPNSRLYQAGGYPTGGPVQSQQDDYGRGHTGSQEDFGSRGRMSSSNVPLPPPPAQQHHTPTSPRSPPPSGPGGRGPPSQSGEKKLVCQSCQQPLGGPFVSAIGKTWHPEHFCCSSCHVSLQNQAFVEENNKLFCEKCYNQYYAPKCAHCNNAIIGDYGKDTRDAICDICSSVASSHGVYDPIVCSKSVNWLKKQIAEANDTFENATRKREEAHTRLLEAKQKIMSYNKKRILIEEQIEHQERDFENMKRMVEYKWKVSAANTNLCVKAENFDERIKFVETNLKAARGKLNGWQKKLSAVIEDYKDKRSRLDQIQRRKRESHGSVSGLESDLMKMKHHIKILNGKKSFRKVKLEATEDEIDSMEEETREAESRQMLAEQHVYSLGIYQEALQYEYEQQRIMTQNAMDQLEALKLIKREKLQKRNITPSVQLVQ